MLPTLRALCRALGDDLSPVGPVGPVGGGAGLDVPVSAVHVSELVDPTRYLDGGELLLTTGLSFRGSPNWSDDYVARLVATGVAGLGFGVGAVYHDLPSGLAQACARAGLPLLVVPAQTPFLTVSRRYWAMLAESGQRELLATLGTHRALIAAAVTARPVPAVLRRLAAAVDGWVAHVSADGRVLEVWPADRRARRRELQAAIDRLEVARLPSVASLPLGADDVVLQPLGGSDRELGYVAVACARPVPVVAQQVTMTAVALLTLEAVQSRRVRQAHRMTPSAALALLRDGQPEAAGQVVRAAGLTVPPDALHPVVLRGARPDDLSDAVQALPGQGTRVWLSGELDGCAVLLLPAGSGEGRASWLAGVQRGVPDVRGVLGPATRWAQLGPQLARLLGLVGGLDGPGPPITDLTATPGGLGAVLDAGAAPAWAHARLAPLLAAEHAVLLATVVGWLRHRGDGAATARELGVHRNTVRHRVARIEGLLGGRLDDMDAATELWLALRLVGQV